MKLFGNKNQTKDFAEQNRKEANSVILKTYISSLMSLVLCVSMFMGTSYAWFTSEVTNEGNEINVGILDVGLYKETKDADGNVIMVELSTATDSAKLLDKDFRWEPGQTAKATIQVVNKGDLAFKYELTFIEHLSEGEASMVDLAKYFDVWVYDYRQNKTQASTATSYADLTEANGWTYVGTLDELLNGKPVLKDKKMVTVRGETATVNAGTTDGVATADTYTIAIHMSKDAGNDPTESIMGKQIKLNVKLVAYQMPSEEDAFGNSNYDNIVTDAASLQEALNSGDAVLIKNIAIDSASERITMNGGTLNGNGKMITYYGDKVNDASVGVLTTNGGTITDLTIDGGANGRALFMTNLASNLNVSNCTFSGAYAFNLSSETETEYTITFEKSTFNSWTSYANVMASANFTGCTFNNTLKPYGDTILTGCTFENATLDVSALENGETITLTNCKYAGTENVSAVVKNNEGVMTVEGATLVVNADDGYLVWQTTEG